MGNRILYPADPRCLSGDQIVSTADSLKLTRQADGQSWFHRTWTGVRCWEERRKQRRD